MSFKSLLKGSVVVSLFATFVLTTALVVKGPRKPTKKTLAQQNVEKLQEIAIKLEIYEKKKKKLASQNILRKYQTSQKVLNARRKPSSRDPRVNLQKLFSEQGPLGELNERQRLKLRSQIVSYVDGKIRRGSIEPRHRMRFIEMQVMDKSLELAERFSQ